MLRIKLVFCLNMYSKIKFKKIYNCGLNPQEVAEKLKKVIDDGWGDFGLDYVNNHILTSKFLILAMNKNEVVGFASAREFTYNTKKIYYLEFTAVSRKFQGIGLSKKLNRIIFIKILWRSILRGEMGFDTVSISPNPRILGLILRSSSYCFPSPWNEEISPKRVWDISNFVLEALGDKYRTFSERNNVLEGFYDETPELVYDLKNYPRDKDPIVNNFAEKNLDFKNKKGREFVIYARYNIVDFWRSMWA